jgi:hypothetical protein
VLNGRKTTGVPIEVTHDGDRLVRWQEGSVLRHGVKEGLGAGCG